MKNKHPIILRSIAFFLLLVFSQKIGAGLLLHNLFHDNVVSNKTPDKQHEEGKGTNYTCTCVDDLLMPFTAAAERVYFMPFIVFAGKVEFIEENISFYKPVLSFLRGPPANIV